jgi:hypothetical protein
VGVGGVLLTVPQTRARLRRVVGPRLHSVWPRLLDPISQPLRLVAGMGANLLLTFGYLVAFIAALLALGAHPALLTAAVVYLAGNTVGSLAPTPGGLGVVETALAAGLTAMVFQRMRPFPPCSCSVSPPSGYPFPRDGSLASRCSGTERCKTTIIIGMPRVQPRALARPLPTAGQGVHRNGGQEHYGNDHVLHIRPESHEEDAVVDRGDD